MNNQNDVFDYDSDLEEMKSWNKSFNVDTDLSDDYYRELTLSDQCKFAMIQLIESLISKMRFESGKIKCIVNKNGKFYLDFKTVTVNARKFLTTGNVNNYTLYITEIYDNLEDVISKEIDTNSFDDLFEEFHFLVQNLEIKEQVAVGEIIDDLNYTWLYDTLEGTNQIYLIEQKDY